MKGAVAILALAVLLVGTALLLDRRAPPAPAEPPLALPDGGAQVRLVQRHDAEVPGSGGRLRVHIGDITRGQVILTLTHRDGRVLISPTSVEEGDRLQFSIGGQRHTLAVLELDNRLLSEDSAVLEFSRGVSELDRIEKLLRDIAVSGLTFIRNGKEYDSHEAAAHLRRKWRAARGRIRTAEQFIDHIATRSSLSGRPYGIRLRDGRVVESAAWLRKRLDTP